MFRSPLRAVDVALAGEGRLAETIAQRRHVGLLVAVLLFASLAFALPFGLVLDPSRSGRVALLFTGALAICFPSLHVFGAYVGCRATALQSLALGLVLTSVAALFTFGFFPILWFLEATMLDDSVVTPRAMSIALLIASFAAGAGQLGRCLVRFRLDDGRYPALIGCWLVLLTFITHRMARFLELV